MRIKYIWFLLIFLTVVIIPCSAFTELIEWEADGIASTTISGTYEANTEGNAISLTVKSIEQYREAVYYEYIPSTQNQGGYQANFWFAYSNGTSADTTNMAAPCDYYISGNKIGSGYVQIIYWSGLGTNPVGMHGFKLYFSEWDITGLTGDKTITIVITDWKYPGNGVLYSNRHPYSNTPGTFTTPVFHTTYPYGPARARGIHYFVYKTPYKVAYELSLVSEYESWVTIDRTINGTSYPSQILAYCDNKTYVNNIYHLSESLQFLIDEYPSKIVFKFGYPVTLQTFNRTITGTNYQADIIYGDVEPDPTPTPTNPPLTQTVTATPTPYPDTCGYWTATLDTNQIHRGGNVTVTLAETDPDDNFDMIEYFTVMPNGQKRVQVRYVNDPGLFGFGAGWVKTYPDTTLPPEASSVAAAKTFTQIMAFSGTNQIGVSILDDKSLVRTLYSDYQAVCGFLLDVIVGGAQTPEDPTVQRIGINVWEAESKAIVTNALICTQDQSTGIWVNQSNGYGGTTYFEAVPGRNLRIYIEKAPWLTYNEIITVPNPPGTHGVYLYRPIEQVANKSAVLFTVRAAGTYPFALSGANINFANETKTTNSGGVAGFYGLDEGESYYYTIARYGYFATSGYITVPAEDLYTTVYMQLNPSIVQPTPTQDNFGPDAGFGGGGVGGDATPTPTPGSGSDGSWFFPGFGGSGSDGTGGTGGTPATPATPLPTLNTTVRQERIGQALNLWGENLPALSQFFILLIMIGGLGMIMDVFDRRKRRR